MRRKNYLWYRFWRHVIVGTGLKFFYKNIKPVGLENIPDNKPIIFVPNHQNSFMDALHVAVTVKPVIYFLTRAQAFKPTLLGKFLWSINMMPVYRVRDGLKSVQKNNAIFEKCFKYLKNNDTILVFAEANHNLKRRIRPLSKGFTRIAFGAEEKFNWDLDLQIVPVGINYTAHREARNTVQVVYGEALPASKYRDAYEEDQNEAAQQMKKDVADAMKKLVFYVQDLKEYPVQQILWDALETEDEVLTDPGISNQRVRKTKEHITPKRIDQAKEAQSLSEKHGIPLRDFAKNKGLSFKEFLLFPLYMFSYFNNMIPYQPVKYLTSKVVKDRAFDASIKFVAGLAAFPLFYLIISLLLLLLNTDGTWISAYLVLSILSAPMFIRGKQLFSEDKIRQLQRSNPEDYNRILDLLESFQKLRNSILNE